MNFRRALVIFSGFFLIPLEVGCNKTAGTKPEIRTTKPGTAADDALDSAKDTLRKEVGLKACRNAIQKINGYFSRNPDQKSQPLTDAQREFLVNQVGLEEEELAEVNSTTFTLLDAHYLDHCFLLRDAVRSFGVQDRPALERAEIAFDWVMRQVRLQERDGPANPPHLVLRRGWGTSLERALVFLALVQQQGIDGCIITYPSESQGQSYSRFWVPGVLLDKKVYLFDTRMGIPLPSPQDRGIATLAEVLAHPDPFQALQIDDKHQYDVTPAQAKKAEIHPAFSLSSLAPRMKYLEGLLAPNNKVKVASDPSVLLRKFQDAVADLGTPVLLFGKFGDPATPLRLFREFLPPAEGGIDKFQRKLVFDMGLVPWEEAFNPYFSDFPENLKLGNDLRVAFQKLFVEFPLPPLRQQGIISVENILQGKDQEEKQKDEMILRVIQSFLPLVTQRVENGAADHYLLAPRTPRDDLIRGRFDDATAKLVEVLDQVAYQRELFRAAENNLPQAIRQWRTEAKSVQAEMVRAGEALRNSQPQAQDQVDALLRRYSIVWQGKLAEMEEEKVKPGPKIRALPQLPPWLILVLGVTAEPLHAEAAYFLALCKHEHAERLQTRVKRDSNEKSALEAWESARQLWNDFLEKHPNRPQAAAARLSLARALAALNQPEAAAVLLQDPKNLTPLENTARLYQARMIKQK